MEISNTLTVAVFIALVLSTLTQLYLSFRHRRHVHENSETVPPAFRDQVGLDAHQKAATYTVTKSRVGQLDIVLGSLIFLAWTVGGGIRFLDSFCRQLFGDSISAGVTFLVAFFMINSLLDLPTSIYSTFVIEQRFGFNRMTAKLFISDLIKNGVLTLAMGVPMAFLVLYLMDKSGNLWWLYVWIVWTGFNLLMMWLFPTVIAPLFNKFSPLEDSELKQRIQNLLSRCGFQSNGIFVMDGSKRSSHGNAYFTGFGKNKRIVFFDTLVKSLSIAEIEAVLAHELGHFKRKHVLKALVMMVISSLIGLALLGYLVNQTWFFEGMGVTQPSTHVALILFLLAVPLFTFFLQPLFAYTSRKREFEADDFAAEFASPTDLSRALVKLYEENANTLTPDPWHSAFYDSHPPAPVRIAYLSTKIPVG